MTERQNDDAQYMKRPQCAEPGCKNEGVYQTPGNYAGGYYCGAHSHRAGYGRGDSMG